MVTLVGYKVRIAARKVLVVEGGRGRLTRRSGEERAKKVMVSSRSAVNCMLSTWARISTRAALPSWSSSVMGCRKVTSWGVASGDDMVGRV
jgi:hypothetical protein